MIFSTKQTQKPNDETQFFLNLAIFLEKKKAIDVLLLDTQDKSSYCTYILIVTALSTLHLKSLAKELILFVKDQKNEVLHFNTKEFDTGWAVINFGNLAIHLFNSELRDKYKLEQLYDINFNTLEESMIFYANYP